ncbi:cache domain-containing sensor histidine kinase [Radiobacillus deserti]|uniref:Sensor histidine kinase n=1 Tax=Radiobacillus deserti TaxID=2594883 RepID=A0A516KDZ7_9BACI|nr:sensor histidine kinase [Radiobacillus deserti]QDP39634.1 sensor histidine kinase [Radiobacillus deserti]
MKRLCRNILRTIRQNSLFFKILFVTLISIITVSVLITFSIFRMSTDLFMETFSITNNKVLDQIKTRFEDFSYSIVNTAIEVQNNGTIKRVLSREGMSSIQTATSSYDVVNQLERIYLNIEPYDANLVLWGEHQHLFNMNYSSWPISWNQLDELDLTRDTFRHSSEILYRYLPPNDSRKESLIVASKALKQRSSNHIYGILYMSIKEKDLKEFYVSYTSEENQVFLLDSEGTIVSSSLDQMIGEKSTELQKASKEFSERDLNYQEIELFGENNILLAEYLPTFNMYLVNTIRKESVMDHIVNMKEIIFISLAIVSLAVFLVFLISRRMTKSLSKLVEQISDMAKYDFNKRIAEDGGYEAKKLAHAFNYMLNELHEYVEIIVETEKKQRKAELEALQHQINPHFLYNTLASVKFMVQQGQKDKATDTIHSLISLLQHALRDVNETITVEQELINLKHYVQINQARYGDRIHVSYFVSPSSYVCRIPKLIIQPFIENAFFHAFTHKKEGFIQVLISENKDFLLCEVVDNGDGMELESLASESNRYKRNKQLFSGIGVSNVHNRIQLLYGRSYGVEISSEVGVGTKVQIWLPSQIDSNQSKENTYI